MVSGAFAALDVPPLTGRIVDLAHLLPDDLARSLSQELAEHERRTGNQVVVLTLPSLDGEPLEQFSHKVATAWQLGQKGTDNGVLLVVVPGDRRVRIEVGYGLEGVLTDAKSSRIIRNEMVPWFRQGDYSRGTAAGVRAILGTIEGTYAPAETRATGRQQSNGSLLMLFVAAIVGVVIGILLGQHRKGLGVLSAGVFGFLTGLSAGWLIAILAGVMALVAVLIMLTASVPGGWGEWSPGGRGDFSGLGSLGGGGGGGFGGGGGSFGGGGASGSW